MFQKILVAIAPSKTARYPFETALNLATSKTSLMLLHVLFSETKSDLEASPPLPVEDFLGRNSSSSNTGRRQQQNIADAGLELLQLQAEIANALGIATTYAQVSGVPGLAICDFARTWEADLIVIGQQKNSGLPKLFPEDTSGYVTRHAPCSVLMVRSPVEPREPIIYAQPRSYVTSNPFRRTD
ncbi:MAG: universal stress protein [Cyanosarcina radialis HA8281-LM2]|jgi:nucleotide-binding universal stress UspA family protein|nr:universal stress protein [Cyanosarcina radialis HA8281-LM2]